MNSKSEFLQKAHMRKSLSESGDKESVLASLLPSLTNAIQQCEENRADLEDAEAPHKDLGVRIGPLIRAAYSSRDTPETVSQSYLRTLFDLDGKSYTTPLAYLKRNVYLLWEIPKEEHRERLKDQQAILDKIVVRKDTGEKTRQQARKVSELATTLYDSLEDIPEDDWTEQKIKNTIGPLIKSISYVSDEKQVQAWGWKFLRWVVSASAAGPALIPSMVMIGKEETLWRVMQACRVAQRMKK